MTRHPIVTVLTLLILLVVPQDLLLAVPPEGRLTVSRQELKQGEVLLLGVRSMQGVEQVEGEFLGKALNFYPTEEGDLEAVIGIDLAQKPGQHPIRVFLSARDSDTTILRKDIRVRKGQFSVDRLTVKKKMVDFDAQLAERIRGDRERMSQALAGRSDRSFGGWFDKPVAGRVSSSFGRRRILNGKSRSPHSGADIRASKGTRVLAPTAGKVVLTDDQHLPGRVVVLDHGKGVFTGYFHLDRIDVAEGQRVKSGQLLGTVGMTGRVTGPHLHWMARIGEARVDPISLTRLRFSRPLKEQRQAD